MSVNDEEMAERLMNCCTVILICK